jgi:hypothetical protein
MLPKVPLCPSPEVGGCIMPCRVRRPILRLLVGFSLLIPALGCCRAYIVRGEGAVESAPCCPRCGRVFARFPLPARRAVCSECSRLARCNCFLCRLRWGMAGPQAAGMAGPACARHAMETPFPRFHPVPKRPVFLAPSAGRDASSMDAPEPETAAPEPKVAEPKPGVVTPQPEKVPRPEAAPAPLPDRAAPPPPKSADGWRPMPPAKTEQASGSSWVFRPVSSSQPSEVSHQQSAISDQPADR